MATRKIPGLAESKGRSGFTLFPDGRYIFSIEKHTEKDSKKGTSTNHTFNLKCIDALDAKKECQDMKGKMYFHRMNEMHDDHESFEQWGHIFVDELKTMCDMSGTKVPKNDEFDIESLVGKTIGGIVKTEDGLDAEGNPRKNNSISMWFKDEEAEAPKAAPKKGASKK